MSSNYNEVVLALNSLFSAYRKNTISDIPAKILKLADLKEIIQYHIDAISLICAGIKERYTKQSKYYCIFCKEVDDKYCAKYGIVLYDKKDVNVCYRCTQVKLIVILDILNKIKYILIGNKIMNEKDEIFYDIAKNKIYSKKPTDTSKFYDIEEPYVDIMNTIK